MDNNSPRKAVWGAIIVILVLVAGWILINRTIEPINIPNERPVSIESLALPEGFSIHIFADDLEGARVIEMDPRGRLVVSQTSEGMISVVEDRDSDGVAEMHTVIAENLDKPHGLAFNCPQDSRNLPCYLYVAEHSRVGRYIYDAESATLSSYQKLADIDASPTDRHSTRTLLFLPPPDEHMLLVSVGSSCDVCSEGDSMRGKIMVLDTRTNMLSEYATGLRNAVFMTLSPVDGRVFATEMGRDGLGDDIPPDEINIIEEGGWYGWPWFYGKNIEDMEFSPNVRPAFAEEPIPSFVDLQAHSAPLGLSFVPEEGWPEEYWYDLLVAYHGSWNRSVPTGYKIVRISLDATGRYLGTEDFITGWLGTGGEVSGRPVDIKVLSGGVAYISDDASGVIYRLERRGGQ